MPTADYSLDDVTAAVLSIGGPGLTTETDLVKKKNTCFLHTMIRFLQFKILVYLRFEDVDTYSV